MAAQKPLELVQMPQKKFYRQRAHANPMSDHILDCPNSPAEFDFASLYPRFLQIHPETKVSVVDVGCGYGGLLVSLSKIYPNDLILGLEIRYKVTDYVQKRIAALRSTNNYDNIACIRTNAMKTLPFHFEKGQLRKMFFLFPDPHFKKSKHKWRIISHTLLDEYAYLLAIGGIIYVATDVEEYMNWVKVHFNQHPLFNEIGDEALKADPLYDVILNSTEEGQKVTRNNGRKYIAAFGREDDPYYKANAQQCSA